MKKKIKIFDLLLGGWNQDDTTKAKSIQVGNSERYYLDYIPSALDKSTPVPLVIDMHGACGTCVKPRENSGFRTIADKEGFIVVYPIGSNFPESIEGQDTQKAQSYNAGPACCGLSVTTNIDDVGFIIELIEKIKSEHNIDITRIYATGMSNGGALAQRLAVEVPDTFAAVVSYAQYLLTEGPHTLQSPIPVMEIHGQYDNFCPYRSCSYCGNPNKVGFPGAETNRDYWAQLNGCNMALMQTKRINGGNWCKDRIYTYENCDGNVKVILVSLNCGHLNLYNYRKKKVDVTQMGWDFMNQFSR